MPLERESPDRSLRSERIRADQAVVNRDDFLAIVAHDLRDMLGGIMLSSKVLAKRAERDEAGASTLAKTVRIGRRIARMRRLIGDTCGHCQRRCREACGSAEPGQLGSGDRRSGGHVPDGGRIQGHHAGEPGCRCAA